MAEIKFSIGQVEWLVDRYHVSTSDAKIREIILEKCKHWEDEEQRELAVKVGLQRHCDNSADYLDVINGEI